jgi:hypothetical protein
MFRQCDGYVSGGHGRELLDFLKKVKMVNGFTPGHESEHAHGIRHVANGMADLAAQLLVAFKGHLIGGIYLHPHDMDDNAEYVYHVYLDNDTLNVKVGNMYGKVYFDGSLETYEMFVDNTDM